MKKRLLALILSLTMIFAMSAVNMSATETTEHTITIENVEAESGEDVAIKVMIENNPGIWGMDLKISYDKSALTLTSVDNGDFYQASEWTKGNLNADVYILSYEAGGLDNITTKSGTLAILNFKVSDTAVAGDYAVTASCNDGDIINVSFENVPFTITGGGVTVKAKPVTVTGVTIDETLSLKTGETKTPGYTVNPAEATNKAVSFKSDNTDVATVNETTGEVTGIKGGTTTITVTTADGNFTDTCIVTVACSHANKTPVAEKSSDCKNKGWDAYVKCDDCGQLFAENGTTEIAEIPFRQLSDQHTGGTATCTKQAVCTVCSQSYGALTSHDYTAETKKAEALKTAGNCRDYAVYYYSCSACGKVEDKDSHTFNGDKVADNHIGGTTLVNQAEANHKTQTNGYTGDAKCLGCGEIIDYGETIPAGAHTPADIWSTDGEYHWKECNVVGCGIVINNSKISHSSTGANVATCQKRAVCDVCGVSYGEVADHDWNTTAWEKDSTGHWHECNTVGCTEKNAFEGHTPDHQGNATEEYAIKCTVCQYEIEAQLGHTHVFDKEVAEEQYIASKANCTDAAKYYKSCKCGEKGTETFDFGEKLGHIEGTAWEKDSTGHWHKCSIAGCGVIIESSKALHTPDREAATEKDPIKCSVCGYVIAPAIGHSHDYSGEWKSDKGMHWNECSCGEEANKAAHKDDNKDGKCDACGYNVGISTVPSNPQTSDSDMFSLWGILLCVSALGVVGIILIGKKKSFR
ncbi:MAG: hypothetical protein E7387_01100 [Ruminococcaceae bacterium]|nr:hypothetical protein [Oscillospiraceae bacterium]